MFNFCTTVVHQYYEAQVYDAFVIKGNTAIFKCHLPSFVSDHIDVISWHKVETDQIFTPFAQNIPGKFLQA